MADDWYLAWNLAESGSIGRFVVDMYFGWGGRVLPFTLHGLALSSDTATHVFKLLTVPCFILVVACGKYLADGAAPRLDKDSLLMAAVLWLGAPVVSETIVQTVGAAGYLWPVAAGLAMLCLFRQARDHAEVSESKTGGWGARVGWFLAGMIVGTGNEQLFAGMFTILIGWGWILWRGGRLRHVAPQVWWGVAGLIVGALILIGSPGNFNRMAAQEGGGGVFSTVVRFGLYLGGAYFALGTGDVGRSLWMGIAIIALTGSGATLSGARGKEVVIWLAASVATLMPMLPLVNFASPRTTFIAVIFLVIGAMTAFSRKTGTNSTSAVPAWLVAFTMASLVAIDGFVGFVANRAIAAEMTARLNLIQVAVLNGQKEVAIPYLTTIPSRLTYMLNPVNDREFAAKLAASYGLSLKRYGRSADVSQPYTTNSLKTLKNSF